MENGKRHFTRKHYLALQGIVRTHIIAAPIEAQEYVLPLVQAMCAHFKAEYEPFDETRFLRLCSLID